MFTDQTITCQDCSAEFTFTADEQAFYREKGFTNPPKRCPACRASRKQQQQRSGGGNQYRQERQLYQIVCVACGCETTVPFRPAEDRPVYCKPCYQSAAASR